MSRMPTWLFCGVFLGSSKPRKARRSPSGDHDGWWYEPVCFVRAVGSASPTVQMKRSVAPSRSHVSWVAPEKARERLSGDHAGDENWNGPGVMSVGPLELSVA